MRRFKLKNRRWFRRIIASSSRNLFSFDKSLHVAQINGSWSSVNQKPQKPGKYVRKVSCYVAALLYVHITALLCVITIV
jgi:hypothetical protein